MESNEIKQKSISGAIWSLSISIILLSLSFLLNIYLGRLGSEVLGSYAFFILVASLIPIFIFFGGNAVFVKYIPELAQDKKIPFVLTYTFIIIIFGSFISAILIFEPRFLHFVVKRDITPTVIYYSLLLAPIILSQRILSSVLQSLIEIKWIEIAGGIPILLNLTTVFIFSFFFRDYFIRNYQYILMIMIVFSYTVSLIVLGFRFWKIFVAKFPFSLTIFLPKRFWRFSIFLHLSTLTDFVFQKADQFLVFGLFNVSSLGLYRAVIILAEFVRWFPLLLMRTTFPMFSNLIANKKAITTEFREIVRINTTLSIFVAAICVLFGKEMLLLFGHEYQKGSFMLNILALVFVISSISTVYSSLILSSGKSSWMFGISFFGSLIQIIVTAALLNDYNILAVAIGRASSLAVVAAIEGFLVYKLFGHFPPPEFILPFLFLGGILIGITTIDINITVRIILFIFFGLFLAHFKIFKLDDFRKVKRAMLGGLSS